VPYIEVTDETYSRLLQRSESFADTADNVIVRLLDATASEPDNSMHSVQRRSVRNKVRQATPRAVPGSILPEREYWVPILEILTEAGGVAPARDVIDALGDRMRSMLKQRDYEMLSMGDVRWRNRARFARLRMTEQGLLSAESPRGIWELTELGRKHLRQKDERE
jgi:Mrr restriction endonuclease-like protein